MPSTGLPAVPPWPIWTRPSPRTGTRSPPPHPATLPARAPDQSRDRAARPVRPNRAVRRSGPGHRHRLGGGGRLSGRRGRPPQDAVQPRGCAADQIHAHRAASGPGSGSTGVQGWRGDPDRVVRGTGASSPEMGPVRVAHRRSRERGRRVRDSGRVAARDGLAWPTREHYLRQWAGLAADAAAAAVAAGQETRAVELLETGRSVLWTEASHLRHDLAALWERAFVITPSFSSSCSSVSLARTSLLFFPATPAGHGRQRTGPLARWLSSSGTRATGGFRYLGDSAGGGVLAAGASFGVGERAELAGPVVPDRVDPDDLAVPRQLHRPGHDGDVDGLAGPAAAGVVVDAGGGRRRSGSAPVPALVCVSEASGCP
jgi:hypothetical protein